MKRFEIVMMLTVDAKSKAEAKEFAKNALDNLNDTMGHCPFPCRLALEESSIEEVEYDEGEDY